MPLVVDRTHLPELRLCYVGDFSDAELKVFLNDLEALLQVPGPKVCVIDLTHATTATARQRQLQAAWIRKNEAALARDFAAAAIVANNAIVRGTVTAIFWLRPLPFPTHVASTLASAEAWLAPYRAAITP